MAERKLDENEIAFVKKTCKDFLRNYIGENLIQSRPELELLVVLIWQEHLDKAMIEISEAFFEWFEKNWFEKIEED